jgi:Glycosyl hydrolase family 65, C-terminal domain
VSFRMQRHGSKLLVEIDSGGCTVHVLDGHPVPIEDGPRGPIVHIPPGERHRIARVPVS